MQKVNVPSIPRAQKILGRAYCLSTDLLGDCVSISGAKTGNIYNVTKFDPTTESQNQAIAVITKKYSTTLCRIQFLGPMTGVYTSLTPGSSYWVDFDSQLTDVRPIPDPGAIFLLQQMGIALSTDELLINPDKPRILRG